MKQLRSGVTTGLCAAAAAKAAMTLLLSSAPVSHIEVEAKNGKMMLFEVIDLMKESGTAKCAVRKDAGDDPDVTNGVKIFAAVFKKITVGF